LGMRAFRHKTRKESFRKAFRIVVAGQGLLLAGVICWMAFR
jgi:uncharacterized membrane protein YsdA (DUF1294 family)